jgi:hypothetical protein
LRRIRHLVQDHLVDEVRFQRDPRLAGLLTRRMHLTGDQTFLFGLNSLLDGIESRFAEPA